eukprot:scaffold27616_cov64-Phaeocystis_antarctica.AAC.4
MYTGRTQACCGASGCLPPMPAPFAACAPPYLGRPPPGAVLARLLCESLSCLQRFCFCAAAGSCTSRNRLSSLSSGRKRQTSSKSASCALFSERSSKSNSKRLLEAGSAAGLWKAARYGCERACSTVQRCVGSHASIAESSCSALALALG